MDDRDVTSVEPKLDLQRTSGRICTPPNRVPPPVFPVDVASNGREMRFQERWVVAYHSARCRLLRRARGLSSQISTTALRQGTSHQVLSHPNWWDVKLHPLVTTENQRPTMKKRGGQTRVRATPSARCLSVENYRSHRGFTTHTWNSSSFSSRSRAR